MGSPSGVVKKGGTALLLQPEAERFKPIKHFYQIWKAINNSWWNISPLYLHTVKPQGLELITHVDVISNLRVMEEAVLLLLNM